MTRKTFREHLKAARSRRAKRDGSLAPQPAALRLVSQYFTQPSPYRCPDHRTRRSLHVS